MDHPFTNDRPIYVQLVERVEQAILTGQYRPDEKLPSVREFASMYQVNPNTMQKALQELKGKSSFTRNGRMENSCRTTVL